MDFVASTYYSDIFMGGLLVLLLIVCFVVVVGSLLFTVVGFLSFSLAFFYFLFYKFLNFLSKIQTYLRYRLHVIYSLHAILTSFIILYLL